MKALLVAAGRGTRLGALTAHQPKPMIPLGGVPMIERILAGIAHQTPIREFVLVTGYRADVLETYLGDGAKWGWQIEYVHQERQLGLANAVLTARETLADAGPFLFTYGDIMVDPANYARFAQKPADVAALVGLNWVPDPWAGAAIYVNDDDNKIERIVEKPPKGTATTHWNNAGLFLFEPNIFDYCARVTPSARGEYELPDALTLMLQEGLTLRGVPLEGAWRDVGTPEDYAAIDAEFTLH